MARELAADGSCLPVVLISSRETSAYGPRLVTCPILGFIAKDELSGSAIRALAGDT